MHIRLRLTNCIFVICFTSHTHRSSSDRRAPLLISRLALVKPRPNQSFLEKQYRNGYQIGSRHRLGQISSRLPHQLTTKPRFYCVPTVFLYVFVEFVELTWHIRHDPKCENRWNFFFKPIFCHELHEILTNGFSHCNRGFLKLQMLFYDFCS